MTEEQRMDLLKFVERASVFIYRANDAITRHMVTHGIDKMDDNRLIREAFSMHEALLKAVGFNVVCNKCGGFQKVVQNAIQNQIQIDIEVDAYTEYYKAVSIECKNPECKNTIYTNY